MSALPWFRFYAKFITDPDIEELSFDDQRHFVFILCMKCNGLLDKEFPNPEKRERAIARRLGLDGEALSFAKVRLIESGLIDKDWNPRSWNFLQFTSDHDPTGAERQARHRKRTRNALRNGRVTPLEQNRTEQNKAEGKKRARKTRLAPDWKPPDEFITWARQNHPSVSAVKEVEVFRDYYIGKGELRVNWLATWRNWIRRAEKYGEANRTGGEKRLSAVEEVRQATGGRRF